MAEPGTIVSLQIGATSALSAGPAPPSRNLIIVHERERQSVEDWRAVAAHVRDIDPGIEPFIVESDQPNSYTRRLASRRPTLVFSPRPLQTFRPLRGKVYCGRRIEKLEQLRLLAAGGVLVPKTTVLRPGLVLDPAEWGEFVVLKPADVRMSSRGAGVQLMRTARVSYREPQDYPPDHPGRISPMIVQEFVDAGERVSAYRVLTIFGAPLYCLLNLGTGPRIRLDAPDEAIEGATIASQVVEKDKLLVEHQDVLDAARKAYLAVPDVPLQGCDVLREKDTGRLFVLEINPGGNTWHFSSRFLAEARRNNGEEFEARRLRQFDAFRTAARVLVARTNAEAE